MNADTRLRPTPTATPPTAPPTSRRVRHLVMLTVMLIIGVALVIAAVYSPAPQSRDLPPPSVSPIQAERWSSNDLPADVQREAQRFRNAVDVDRR